ncbi:MAG: MarR family transcriptional regulator [Paracoccaceae bacterium]|nr:MarR family transcriptional regulator [Paracoccaceae bacterium]
MQKDAFDLQLFLPYLLNQAAEASSLGFARIYKERYGLLRTEWRVLFHLGLYGRMTARDIGAMASIHKTKISRAVQRLEARRYLKRARDDKDRRKEHLELTAKGREVYADLYNEARSYEARLLRNMAAEDVTTLRRLLTALGG